MTAALKSILGLAKQSAQGAVGTVFKYLLYNQGSVAPNNVVLPLDIEIGATSPLISSMVKTGVTGAGAVEFIPRPDTLAYLMNGLLGEDNMTAGVAAAVGTYSHALSFNHDDAWDVPYFTAVHAPGGMWADQILDCRISAVGLSWKAANFLRGQVGFSGGLPSKVSVPTGITTDTGPQFLTALSSIELPTATAAKVISGSFMAGNAIPLDEQWIVGSYSPDNFDITTRAFSINLVVKITDATLYTMMMYDPAGASAWAAGLMKEGDFKLKFVSDKLIGTTAIPYSVQISADSTSDNVVWAADPIAVRAGKQVIMSMTGVFLNTLSAAKPVVVTVVNDTATAY